MYKTVGKVALLLLIAISIHGICEAHYNKKPKFIKGEIIANEYDGITNDLLTGGLGKSGIEFGAPAPGFVDPDNPTAEELRTLAIQTNYRAVLDPSAAGGYGVLYGPNVDPDGKPTLGEGMVAGKEYLAYAVYGKGKKKVTLMVQVPASFDPNEACIVTAPSSGSRGIYGAIGTSGEWGLKRGCVVCYSDGGKGTGVHDLETNTVNLIRGQREDAEVAGRLSHFTAIKDPDKLAEFNSKFPNRLAVKHTHSGQNPELDWGKNVLQSIELAFYVLNLKENFGIPDGNGKVRQTIVPENTIVIASSISNGGTASVRAAEEDTKGLIDGVAVSEPNLSPKLLKNLLIKQGARRWNYREHSKLLYDYFSFINMYQSCADLAQPDASLNTGTFYPDLAISRCASLAALGLLTAKTPVEQAQEAQQIINDYGILEEQNWVQPTQAFLEFNEAIAVTYANAAGKFSVTDNLCGISFAGIDAAREPAPLSTAGLARLFGVFSGVPPGAGINLINNDSTFGAVQSRFSFTDGVQDQNLKAALCYRSLFTGKDQYGRELKGKARKNYIRVKDGLSQIPYSGELRGIPAIIVHGRNDGVVPLNHSSRPYYALNRITEGKRSNLKYYEILNANHLDALIAVFPGFQERFIPLHYYFDQAVSLMYNHLRYGAPLPRSQVVRTVPRGENSDGVIPAITLDNVPPILHKPAKKDLIRIKKTKKGYILDIPEG